MNAGTAAAVGILNAGLLAFSAYHLWSRSMPSHPPFDERPIPYGVRLDDVSLRMLAGGVGHASWEHVLLFFPPADGESAQRAHRTLAELGQRLGQGRLAIVAVLASTPWFRRGSRSPLLSIADTQLVLHTSLRIGPEHRHGGISIVDRSGIVKFKVGHVPSGDELRQLAEKFALGVVTYGDRSNGADALAIGVPLPSFPARHLQTGRHELVRAKERGSAAVIVFAPECATCGLELKNVLDDTRAFAESLKRGQPERTLILLFSEEIDSRDVLGRDALPPALLAASYHIDHHHVGLSDNTRTTQRPFVILTDVNGVVTAIDPLPERSR